MRFWMAPGQKAHEVPDGSGANRTQNSGGFRGKWLMRVRRVPGRYRMRFWKVPVQIGDEGRKSPGQIAKNLAKFPELLGIMHIIFWCLTGILIKNIYLIARSMTCVNLFPSSITLLSWGLH